jgi:glycosyltransferase involved in cell wall biosynthesis
MNSETDKTRLPISAFLIAKNEADRIGAAIASVRDWVEEVIVVDGGSTDETAAVARRAGARVLFQPWQGFGLQKRSGEDACRNDWVLNLDADERVTPELADEIKSRFAEGKPDEAGYRIRVCQVYPHQPRPARWVRCYNPIRLYDRRRGRFSSSPVHDSVVLHAGARSGQLCRPMLHRSVRSLSHFVEKLNQYTNMQADDIISRGGRASLRRLLLEMPMAFLKDFFLRRHVFLGRYGFVVSVSYAYFRFLRLAKVYEQSLNGEKFPALTAPAVRPPEQPVVGRQSDVGSAGAPTVPTENRTRPNSRNAARTRTPSPDAAAGSIDRTG